MIRIHDPVFVGGLSQRIPEPGGLDPVHQVGQTLGEMPLRFVVAPHGVSDGEQVVGTRGVGLFEPRRSRGLHDRERRHDDRGHER